MTSPSNLDNILLIIKEFISSIGTFIILVGVLISAYRFISLHFFPQKFADKQQSNVDLIRRDLGRTIILGLEFIIAADVIATTTTPDYYSLGILAIIVLIRTFLSFTLNREISQPTTFQANQPPI